MKLKDKHEAETWRICKPGKAGGVTSSLLWCGYTAREIASLRKAGYRVYRGGKPVAKSEDAERR